MQFGIFYEHQLPRPWQEDSELRLITEALDQVELADRLGIDYAWEVEHHFLEEYSHSSAPEVFLAACSQRTRRIRLGHGIVIMPPRYNHPARVAERIAMLDLVSGGRVEFGTGESASRLELEAFGVEPADKRAAFAAKYQCRPVESYEAIPRVTFHHQLMEWVTENLIRNAIDASDKPYSTIQVALRWKPERREVELLVKDEGRGMTPRERRKAFTPGFTTKRRGWGLGLALARRVVREYHRGRISIVESTPGRGTTVAVALPVAPSPS